MRRLIVPLLSLFCSVPALAQWQPVSTPAGLGGELFECQLDPIDGQTAWVINSFYWVPPYTVRIWRTTDGGQTWQNAGPAAPGNGRFTIGHLEALDSRHAWVMMQRTDAANAALPPELHYTADGGQTWTRRSLPAASNGIGQLRFLSPTEGLLVDFQSKTIYRTTDGGQTWAAPLTLPTLAAGQRLYDLQAAPGLLWTQVYNPSSQVVGFWASTDGGQTWQAKSTPTGFSGVVFRDAQHALLSSVQGGMLSTSDGGQTWTAATLPPFRLGPQAALHAVPGTTAYAAGAFGQTGGTDPKGSAVSYDDGQTWTTLETSNTYYQLQFTGPDAGWHIRAEFFVPTVQYEYQSMGRYNGPALTPSVTASQPPRALLTAAVFPNPSRDGLFTLQLPESAGRVRSVRVLDALGREVYRSAALPASQRLDLSRQPKGLYALEVLTDTGVVRRKLLTE
jgi:photosystem II stability/assembly factor-like uncharacterized protein